MTMLALAKSHFSWFHQANQQSFSSAKDNSRKYSLYSYRLSTLSEQRWPHQWVHLLDSCLQLESSNIDLCLSFTCRESSSSNTWSDRIFMTITLHQWEAWTEVAMLTRVDTAATTVVTMVTTRPFLLSVTHPETSQSFHQSMVTWSPSPSYSSLTTVLVWKANHIILVQMRTSQDDPLGHRVFDALVMCFCHPHVSFYLHSRRIFLMSWMRRHRSIDIQIDRPWTGLALHKNDINICFSHRRL